MPDVLEIVLCVPIVGIHSLLYPQILLNQAMVAYPFQSVHSTNLLSFFTVIIVDGIWPR
jgi:hypothetical protein